MQKTKTNMDKKQTQISKNENIKKVFKRMIADKRAVQSYIREHGTLDGFRNEKILFAKPL